MTAVLEKARTPPISIGKPRLAHGASIHRLVTECKPLDVNSRYAYLILCEHFFDTCVIAESASALVGFVSAYHPPRHTDTIFVWQVAVSPNMRGRNVAGRMLRELLARSSARACRYLETTVSPSNTASRRLFLGLARELAAPVQETLLFGEREFGEERHEREMLIRIGPFPGT